MKPKETLTALSLWSVKVSAHPAMQPLTLVGCVAWLELGSIDMLTNFLSIWAIVLSLMLLTKMVHDDEDSERRWAATQAKLDELIKVTAGARDELAHLEDRPLNEIEQSRC